jgi:hypothetical protein
VAKYTYNNVRLALYHITGHLKYLGSLLEHRIFTSRISMSATLLAAFLCEWSPQLRPTMLCVAEDWSTPNEQFFEAEAAAVSYILD